ncbi:hypothetical protein KDL29_03085 [bacterium]|nr:hypothetical protein [bacterium]
MGMQKGIGFAGVLAISLASLVFGACGGGNITGYVVPDNPYYYGGNNGPYYSGNSDYYYQNGYYYDQYGYYDQFGYYDGYGNQLYDSNDPAYVNIVNRNGRGNDPFMQNYANINDRTVSQFVNSTYSEMLADFGGSLQDLLVRVDGNSVDIPPGEYTLASRNAVLSEDGGLDSAITLNSSYDGVSLVTYTLEEFSGYEQLASFAINGTGSFGSGDRNGVYFGIRQYGDRDTRWYGPYRNGMEWKVRPLRWDERYQSRHCFVTVAVFGGDSVTVNHMRAEVAY